MLQVPLCIFQYLAVPSFIGIGICFSFKLPDKMHLTTVGINSISSMHATNAALCWGVINQHLRRWDLSSFFKGAPPPNAKYYQYTAIQLLYQPIKHKDHFGRADGGVLQLSAIILTSIYPVTFASPGDVFRFFLPSAAYKPLSEVFLTNGMYITWNSMAISASLFSL